MSDTNAMSPARYAVSEACSHLIDKGASSLSETQLLSIMLDVGPRKNPQEMAAKLLVKFGSLRALLTASADELQEAGLSRSNFARLQAGMELTRRHYQELMTRGCELNGPRATHEFLRMRLRDLQHEVFCCVYLDIRHRVIKFEQLFRGTIGGSSVHPREVVKHALACNAAAVIFAHNHPSGVAEPSREDELITRRLKEALALVNIRVLDHLIVGDGYCESFAERGLL